MIEKKLNVASFDVYPNSTIKPAALQRHMQQLAREDCDAMGCTYNDMRAVNMIFVMTKLAIDVKAPVFAYDELTVKTFQNRVTGVTFEREFEFFKNGEKVIHATTQWVIVKYDDRTIVRPKLFPFEIPSLNLDCGSLPLPRSIVSDDQPRDAGIRPVKLSDLDENDHLNNCVYSDIVMDYISDYNRKTQYVKEVKIIFKHEAKLYDELQLFIGTKKNDSGELSYTASVNNNTSGSPCFEAEITLADI